MPSSVSIRLLAVTVVLALAGCGSSAHAVAADVAPPAPSPVGATNGDAVTATIGTAGGTVSAKDHGVTVTIPAGALTADTTISIQPIENTAGAGIGVGYRLTPAGQTFAQSVRITFPYSDADIEGTAPEALGIAFQDAAGRWEFQTSTALDTTARTLTVLTKHFTDWSKVAGLQLRPGEASVKVKDQISLKATICLSRGKDVVYVRKSCGDPTSDDAAAAQIVPGTWSVNGAVGGNVTVGTVQGVEGVATYFAPAKKPSGVGGKSIVAVTVQVKSFTGTKLLVSNITIIDGYHVVGSFEVTDSNMVCAGGIAAYVKDTFSFSLTDQHNIYTVTDIVNSPSDYPTPQIPNIGGGIVVTKRADAFDATEGKADVSGDLVTVAVKGNTVVGDCTYLKGFKETGTQGVASVGFSFYVSKFKDGSQVGTPDNRPGLPWTWVVTEQ